MDKSVFCMKMESNLVQIFNRIREKESIKMEYYELIFRLESEAYQLIENRKKAILIYIKNYAKKHYEKYGYISSNFHCLFIIMKILDYVGIEHGVYIDELIVSKLYDINEYENQFENIVNVFFK